MMQTFAVESGVAIPEARFGRKSDGGPFPFMYMKAGDSFLIPKQAANGTKLETLRVYALLRARQLKIRATTRKVKDGIRVWRVK